MRVACLLLLPLLASCVKVAEETVVLPDGSGKLTFTIAFKATPGKDERPEEDFLNTDPDDILKNLEGIVAVARPKAEVREGWRYITLTFYFDDINRVKCYQTGDDRKDRKLTQEFSFRRENDGFSLTIDGSMMGDKSMPANGDTSKMPEDVRKGAEEAFREMISGFEFRQSARLPGRITSVEGFQTSDGRSATFRVDGDELVKMKPEDRRKWEEIKRFKTTCGPSEISESEQEEFHREIEKAKADWTELKKEMKKRAEEKRGNTKKPVDK